MQAQVPEHIVCVPYTIKSFIIQERVMKSIINGVFSSSDNVSSKSASGFCHCCRLYRHGIVEELLGVQLALEILQFREVFAPIHMLRSSAVQTRIGIVDIHAPVGGR